MLVSLLKLFHLTLEIAAVAVYHLPRWLLSGVRTWLYEDRKGTWTFVRHLRVRMKHHMPSLRRRAGLHDLLLPDHTAVEGPGGVWIPAVPDDFIVGEIDAFARRRKIVSIPIPGYWIHKDKALPFEALPLPGEKIIYFLHGGGYVAETAHPDGVISTIPKGFLRNSSSPLFRRTFSVEYRLSRPGEPGKGSVFPFPAALIDALAGYLYFLNLGFRADDVILTGDSAGANLALALIRYLLSSKEEVKLPDTPATLVLLSPYADVGEQFHDNHSPKSSQTRNAQRDWLNRSSISMDGKIFVGGRPEHVELAYRNPYISPGSPLLLGSTADFPTRTVYFKGFPRTFIDNGSFDTFYDQIIRLRNAMVEDLGEDLVFYNEVDGQVHEYMAIDWCDPDRTETSKKVLKWLGL